METTFDSTNSYDQSKRAKNNLADDARDLKSTATAEFKNFVTDIEDVVKRVANVSDADVVRVRGKIQSALASTKGGITATANDLKEQARKAVLSADNYVRDSPWQAVGYAAAAAAILGLSIGYLASRR